MSRYLQALVSKLCDDPCFPLHFPKEVVSSETLLVLNNHFEIILATQSVENLFLCKRALMMQRPLALFLELSGAEPSIEFNSLVHLRPLQKVTHSCALHINGYDSVNIDIGIIKFVRQCAAFYLLSIEKPDSAKQEDCYFENSVLDAVSQKVGQTTFVDGHDAMLASIVNALPGRSHYKAVDRFTYQIINAETLKLVGFSGHQQMVGMDDFALAKHLGTRWPVNYAQEVQSLDAKVISEMKPIIGHNEKPYLDANGRIVKHSLNKIPVHDMNGNPVGILTFCIDKVSLLEPIQLYKMYLDLYSKKQKATKQYMKHIGLDTFLQEEGNDPTVTLTARELECLLMYIQGLSAKEIGNKIKISNRTVEAYLESLRYKMDCSNRSQINEAMQHVFVSFRRSSSYFL